MSLAEVFDTANRHKNANGRMETLKLDGSLIVDNITVADLTINPGDLTVTAGDVIITAGELITNVIKPALPGADLVVLPNGGPQVFDVQTALSRCNALETDSIDTKSGTPILLIGGTNTTSVETKTINVIGDINVNSKALYSSAVITQANLVTMQINPSLYYGDALTAASIMNLTRVGNLVYCQCSIRPAATALTSDYCQMQLVSLPIAAEYRPVDPAGNSGIYSASAQCTNGTDSVGTIEVAYYSPSDIKLNIYYDVAYGNFTMGQPASIDFTISWAVNYL